MFLGEQSKAKALFQRISLFQECSKDIQRKILFAAISNDSRFFPILKEPQLEMLQQLKLWAFDFHSSSETIFHLISQILGINFSQLQQIFEGKSSDWLKELTFFLSRITDLYSEDVWIQGVLRNLALFFNGFCPFVHFAFGRWHWESHSPSKIADLIEVSTAYLYRLAPPRLKLEETLQHVQGEGGYCFIVEESLNSNSSQQIVSKIPKNLAAEAFINQQEARVLEKLASTSLNSYIPKLVHYDLKTGILHRSYLEGVLGSKLLETLFFVERPESIKQMEILYHLSREQERSLGVFFDLHPGNFIWSQEAQSWFLVDLGPIAKIGSDYFPLNSFEAYFKKVWQEHAERKQKNPIRSIDLGLELSSFFPKGGNH